MKIVINENQINERIDLVIKNSTEYSRTYIANLINEGYVSVNDIKISKSSYKVKNNDIIQIEEKEDKTLDILPENIKIDIIYEDFDILIVNKERGMVVHPSNGHSNGTLVNAIMYHCKDNLSSINGVIRPGIVHRIDKDTSGILCICKNDYSHNFIAKQFAEHSNIRKYKAIVKGVIKENEGVIDKPIGRDIKNRLKMAINLNGKEAKTYYKVIEKYNNYTLIECELFTGRTHQIRVHMKHLGYPLLGDLTYGNKDKNFPKLDGQILHADCIEFTHPKNNKRISFKTPLPEYFNDIISKIKKLNL